MRIDSITLENYRSFSGSTEVKLPYKQEDLNIIKGSEGSGKTTIVEAIRWLLGESDDPKQLYQGYYTPNLYTLDGADGKPVRAKVSLLLDTIQKANIRLERTADYTADLLTRARRNYAGLHIINGKSIEE